MPIGVLIIFLPLIVASVFYMMKDDDKSPARKTAVPEKTVVEKKAEKKPEVKIVEKTIEKTVEKTVEKPGRVLA